MKKYCIHSLLLVFVFLIFFKTTSSATEIDANTDNSTDKYGGYNITGYNEDTYRDYTADGSVPDDANFNNEKDETGRVTQGSIFTQVYKTGEMHTYDIRVSGSTGLYILFDKNANSAGGMFLLVSLNDTSYVEILDRMITGDGAGTYHDKSNISLSGKKSRSIIAFTYYPLSTWELGVFATNIPIFDSSDKESIDKYVNDGDYSGAENAPEVDSPGGDSEYSSDIELPKGVKIEGKFVANWKNSLQFNSEPRISWLYPSDWENYQYDIQFRAYYNMSDGSVTSGNWRSPDNYVGTYGKGTTLDGSDIDYSTYRQYYQFTIEAQNKYLSPTNSDVKSLKQVTIRIRNRKGNKVSNWVKVECLADGNSSATVTDEDDNTVPDDEYDGGNVTDGTTDGGSTDGIGIGSLLSYIRSGFGLLGDTGIITLMSRCFVYLPASIWTMLKFLVAMMIAITIIGLVKDVVT